jgi:predicted RNase H-like nuclease (RuvC/YqgF family)
MAESFEELMESRVAWREVARQQMIAVEFYQSVLQKIGKILGKSVITSDDGSVQQDVLVLKIPEAVEKLKAEAAKGPLVMDAMRIEALENAVSQKERENSRLQEGLERADKNQRKQRDALFDLRDHLNEILEEKATDDSWDLYKMNMQLCTIKKDYFRVKALQTEVDRLRLWQNDVRAAVGVGIFCKVGEGVLDNSVEVLARVRELRGKK